MKAMNKIKRFGAMSLAGMLLMGALAGCGNSSANDSKTDSDSTAAGSTASGAIDVVYREDGSGTKEEFENLAGTQEKGATAQAQSTQDVEKTLASDKNAIGYAAYGSLSKDSGVRLLSIDGVAPTP